MCCGKVLLLPKICVRQNCPAMIYSILIGLAAFLVIGSFYPIVIKTEYYFSARSWWVFLVVGVVSLGASLVVSNIYCSTMLGVLAATNFWAINELFEQEDRVAKGWYPKNPKRDNSLKSTNV